MTICTWVHFSEITAYGWCTAVVRNRGAICNTQGCRELIHFLILYHWKDIFKMSPKLNPNCYGFATGCRKLYFCFVRCRKPKKVGNHWFTLSQFHCFHLVLWFGVRCVGYRCWFVVRWRSRCFENQCYTVPLSMNIHAYHVCRLQSLFDSWMRQ